MSEVISFRLDPRNPREAKALQVLEEMITKGYSVRFVISEALILSRCYESDSERVENDLDIQTTLRELTKMLANIQTGELSVKSSSSVSLKHENLGDSFINSIKLSSKPGLKAA